MWWPVVSRTGVQEPTSLPREQRASHLHTDRGVQGGCGEGRRAQRRGWGSSLAAAAREAECACGRKISSAVMMAVGGGLATWYRLSQSSALNLYT